jgi:hypothetical protein
MLTRPANVAALAALAAASPIPAAGAPTAALGRPHVTATQAAVSVRVPVTTTGRAVLRVEARSGRRVRTVATRVIRASGVQRVVFANRGDALVRVRIRPAGTRRWTAVRTARVPQPVPRGY